MTIRHRWLSAGVCTTMLTGLALAAAPGAAQAATTPPWQVSTDSNHDVHNVGTLAFYDATGAQVTSGSTLAPLGKYVEASGLTPLTGNTKATLYAYTPNSGINEGAWSGQALTGATVWPNASAPAPLSTSTKPVVTENSATDTTLDDYSTNAFPNTSTTTGYQHVYELRVKDSGTSGNDTNYASADVLVDSAAQTWTQVFPASVTATSVVLTADKTGDQPGGTAVTYTATVTPSAAAGSVQLYDGSATLGAPFAVTSGTGTSAPQALSAGDHTVTAVFTPTDTTTYSVSPASNSQSTHENAPTATTTALTLSGAGPVTVGTSETLTATETPAAAGSVQFFDNGAALGAAVAVDGTGKATKATTPAVGTHAYTATFTPTSAAAFTGSTGTAPALTVSKATGTVTATLSAPSTAYGSTVNATITVGGVPGITPTGTVTLTSGSTTLGSGTLVNGTTTVAVPTKALTAGSITITVAYSGDGNVNAGTGTVTLSVTKGKTTETAKLSKTTIKVNTKGKLTVTLKATGFTPSGKVTVVKGGKTIASGTLKSGKVTITLPKLKKGKYTLTVKYAGSATAASTSKTVKLTVK